MGGLIFKNKSWWDDEIIPGWMVCPARGCTRSLWSVSQIEETMFFWNEQPGLGISRALPSFSQRKKDSYFRIFSFRGTPYLPASCPGPREGNIWSWKHICWPWAFREFCIFTAKQRCIRRAPQWNRTKCGNWTWGRCVWVFPRRCLNRGYWWNWNF